MGMLLTPLNEILSSGSKVRLLRALMPLTTAVSGREAARLARIATVPAFRALDDLTAVGVLRREETPSQHLYQVNRSNYLVCQGLERLFEAEKERGTAIAEYVRELLTSTNAVPGAIKSVAVFGSSARGEDKPGSDFDLLVVVDGGTEKSAAAVSDRVHETLSDGSAGARDLFGIDLSPVVITFEQFRERHASEDPFVLSALAESRTLWGKHPSDLIDGKDR